MTNPLPTRPLTPALDALWHKYGKGADRYTLYPPPAVGWNDDALHIYRLGKEGFKSDADVVIDPADIAAVPESEVAAADAYLNAVMDAADQGNGGFLPGTGPNETPLPQSAVQDAPKPTAVPATPVAPAVPVAPVAPAVQESSPPVTHPPLAAPAVPPVVVVAPLTPGAVVTLEHHEAATSWLAKTEHAAAAVAGAATPENLDRLSTGIAALKMLFGLFRH